MATSTVDGSVSEWLQAHIGVNQIANCAKMLQKELRDHPSSAAIGSALVRAVRRGDAAAIDEALRRRIVCRFVFQWFAYWSAPRYHPQHQVGNVPHREAIGYDSVVRMAFGHLCLSLTLGLRLGSGEVLQSGSTLPERVLSEGWCAGSSRKGCSRAVSLALWASSLLRMEKPFGQSRRRWQCAQQPRCTAWGWGSQSISRRSARHRISDRSRCCRARCKNRSPP